MAISSLTQIDEITSDTQIPVAVAGQDYRTPVAVFEDYINATLGVTGVVPGIYGSTSQIPVLTINTRGQITAASVVSMQSFFDSAFSLKRLDQLATPTSSFSLGNVRLLNLADPVAGTDAVNRNYVDALLASGGIDGKASVLCGSTTNLVATIDGTNQILTATSNGVLTLDTVSPAVGKRVLIKNQTTQQNNGIYVVTNAGSAGTPWVLTRSVDATTTTLTSSAYVFVESGATLSGTGWLLTAADPIVLGTTALPWVQFNGGSAYTAGTGLTLVGNQFSVSYGTTSGTAAQGNDSRITGALQASGGTMTGTLTTKNLVETRTTNATASGNVALDLSLGTIWALTLTGNVTGFTISNPSNCTAFSVRIAQDATGGRTVAWSFSGATVRWPSAITPTQTSTLSKADWYHFISSDGGTSFDAVQGSQNF